MEFQLPEFCMGLQNKDRNMMLSQILVDRFLRNEISHQYQLHVHEKLILVFLASYMGKKSMCYPSVKTLAINCSLSVDSIKRGIRSLEKKGLIGVSRFTGSNNHYILNLPNINQPTSDSTECTQHLEANSSLPRCLQRQEEVLIAIGDGAVSTVNNIINNTKEGTSLKQSKVENSQAAFANDAVIQIFEYWKTIMNHPRAKLDSKRKRVITNALKLGYSLSDLKQAIDGCANTPYNMGKNENGSVYDDIGLILRDADRIERFMNNANSTAHEPNSTNDLMAGVI